MRSNRPSIFIVSAALALVHAGCGGNGSDATASTAPATYFALVVNSGTSPSLTAYGVNASTGAIGAVADSVDMTGKLPQWVAAHPTKNVVYVTAYDNQVHAFSLHSTSGVLTEIDAEATNSTPAKVVVTPDGQYLYVANIHSGAHSISVYSISTTDGTLTSQSQFDMLAGNIAWDIATEPASEYLYALDVNNTLGPVMHAYTIGALGALAEAPGSPSSPGGNPRSLATRLNQLYVNWYDEVVYQYSDQTVPLTPMVPPSAFGTGFGLSCTVVGNHFYRYVDWPVVNKGIYTFSIDAGGALTQMPGSLALTGATMQITGGVDGKFLYTVDSDNDTVRWASRNATTGALGTAVSLTTADYPSCLTVVRTQ